MSKKNKRVISLILSAFLTVSLIPSYLPWFSLPAAAVFEYGIVPKDDTDLTIDFGYAERNKVQSPDDVMRLLGQDKIISYAVKQSDWATRYSECPWRHATTIEPNSKGAANDIRTYLESTDDIDTYIALNTDIIVGPYENAWAGSSGHISSAYNFSSSKWWDNRDMWEPVKITKNKVLDLNGHKLEITYAGNINHDKNMQSTGQERSIEPHRLTAFEIENGATLTIIDSSEWRGKGTGKIGFYAGWVQHHDFDMYWYDHRDLFHVNNGNLIVYGGTFEAGGSKMIRKTEYNFTLEAAMECVGMAVEFGENIAKYATGISTADAAYRDVLDDVANLNTGKATASPKSESEEQKKTPTQEIGGRNKTVNEKASDKDKNIAKGASGTPEGENKATEDGKAKNDTNTRVAKAQNEIVNQVVNKQGIMGIVNSGFSLFKNIDNLCGSKDKEPISNNIKGTVVRVAGTSTFASYGGHYIGYGSTPNTRNAVIEVNLKLGKNAEGGWTYDKTKEEGGRAYIYDGDFEANSGANVFNMYHGIDEATVPAVMYVRDPENNRIKPTDVKITYDEHYGADQLFYQNHYDLADGTIEADGTVKDKEGNEIVPIPVNTANVQVRGGTFHCNYDLVNMAKLEEGDYGYDHPDGEHFRTFPGTSGSVNLGVDSFGADLIRDGRIQIEDNTDGCLVLLDDDEESYNGLFHYRLFCGDTELRTKSYLNVFPNKAQTNSSFSMQLAHYGGTGHDSQELYQDDKDNIRAPYRQMENYFNYEIDGLNAGNYSIKPNFHHSGTGSEQAQMDVYGSWLANSEVWYYPEPLDHKGKSLVNMGYGDTVAYLRNNTSGQTIYQYDSMAISDGNWRAFVSGGVKGYTATGVLYEGRKNIRTNMKYFTYNVYKVDPLTRENLPANPNTAYGVDDPLITVRYGAGTDDPLKCKIPLVDVEERIRNTRTDIDWKGYQPGEMYRIVLEVEERINAGVAPVSYGSGLKASNNRNNVDSHNNWKWGQELDTAKTTTSILFRCYSSTEQHEGSRVYNELDFTPAQWSYNAYDKDTAPDVPPLADDATEAETKTWLKKKAASKANNAISAGDYAQINLVNAKTGMTDFEGDVQVFDIYYQWWEVTADGKPVRLLAGTDNVFDDGLDKHTEFEKQEEYEKYMEEHIAEQKAADPANKDTYDLEDKTRHQPNDWNYSYVKPDGTQFQYCNTVDPNSPDAEYMDTNGLPKRKGVGNVNWTAEQIHLYSSETTNGRSELTRWEGNLSLRNNNVFAFNTDTCYIPRDMSGKYIQVKAIALNVRWPMAYDKKQTFESHIVKVIDPAGELRVIPYREYDGDMKYATYDHPAKLVFSQRRLRSTDDKELSIIDRLGLKLDEGESITTVTYFANGREKTFTDLNFTDPKEQPIALYPNDFYDEDTDLKKLKGHEVDVQVQVTTSKGKVFWRQSPKSDTHRKVLYEVEAESVDIRGEATQKIKLSDIRSGKYDSTQIGSTGMYTDAGLQIFNVTPLNATVGYDFTEYTNTNPKIGSLNPNGYFIFSGEHGETTVTVKDKNGGEISKTLRVVEDIDSFEINGINPPIIGENLDFTSPTVPKNAPYHITGVKWFRFDSEVKADEAVVYNSPYSIEITVAPNEFCEVSSIDTFYSMTVGTESGISTTVNGRAKEDYDYSDQKYTGAYTISYTYPAKTDHDAQTIDKIYMNFPTEVKEGDNFLKWAESVEIYTNGYNEGFTFDIKPTYEPDAEKIAGIYGYDTEDGIGMVRGAQLNYFMKGVQNGAAVEITIPENLTEIGDVFAENIDFYINGEKSSNMLTYSDGFIRVAATNTLTVISDEINLPVNPEFSIKKSNAIVGQTMALKDLLDCDDPRVDIVMTGIDFYKSENEWDEHFTYDLEAGTLTPLKAENFTVNSWDPQYLYVKYRVVFDADGDGYPEYQYRNRISYGEFYASAADAPTITPTTEKTPVKVKVTVLDPDGKTASEGEYTYDFKESVIKLPENTLITGIFDKDGKSASESSFKDGGSYTVKTVSADSIEIYSGADSVYAFFKDADGKNLNDLQISTDSAHFTKDDCITDLKTEAEYTLCYRQGINGKVYTKKFRTAKQDLGVYIGRQPVTDANLGELETDGWHYDPETKTLTLKNFTLKDMGSVALKEDYVGASLSYYAGIYASDDLNVKLIGNNTVDFLGSGVADAVIWSDKELTVTGNGSLNLANRGDSLVSYGLHSKEGNVDLNSTGTLAMEKLTCGFYAPKGSINYSNGTIDFKPKSATIGSLASSSQKDGIKFDGKVHELSISNGSAEDKMEELTENEFAAAKVGYTRIVPKHNATEKIVSAEHHASGTCDEGCTYYLACDCGHISEETFKMTAEEHSLVKHAAKASTCTESGTVAYWECEHCGGRYADADGTKPITDAEIVVAPLGHDLVHTDATNATCTEDGYTEHWSCSRCGKRFADKDGKTLLDTETAVTPATGHDWIHYFAKDATCAKDGYIEHWKCANCEKYSADKEGKVLLTTDDFKIKAIGHTWSEWTVIKEATEESEGEEVRICSRCDDTEKRVIQKKQPVVTTTTTSTTTSTTTTKPTTTTTSTTTTKPTTTTTTSTTTTKPTTTTTSTTTTKPTTTTTTSITTTKPTTTTTSTTTTKPTTTTTSTTTTKPTTTTTSTTTTKPTTTTTSTTTTTKPTTTTTISTTTTTKPTTTTTTSTTTTKPTTTTTTSTTTTKPTTTTTTSTTTTTTTSNNTTISTTSTSKTTTSFSTNTTTTNVSNITTTSTTTPSVNYNIGDVDNNNNIDAVDASKVLAYYARISTKQEGGFSDSQKQAADVNKDGIIDAVDASKILAYYAYLSTTKENIIPLPEFLKK
ncbi:dockerin type I domain-containing protein [Ruminococcus sp.]|uniref:dockerin type I domain-containing protein n=1 Tax=Ruminococcus sp. TaxID=41978 RepID=UPI0025E84CE4|nr:dockerin type I domain-containing protein [Ruminococcus sp.]